jgi:PAS domain S-box-containing protein
MTQTPQIAVTQLILQALQGLHDTDEALHATVDQLHLALEVSCCLLVKPAAGQVIMSQSTTKTDRFTDTGCLQSHFQRQLVEGNAVVCDRLNTIPSQKVQQFLQTSEVCAVIIVPLICHRSYLGEICLYQCNRPRQWTATELDLVQTTANYIAIALYQTELHQRLEHVEQTEIALRRREQEFRALVEHSPDVIARFDRDLRHLYINPAVTQATGLSPDCLVGRTNREVWGSQETIEMWESALREVFSTGLSKTIEFEFSTSVGIKHHQSRLVPEFDSQGRVEFVLTVCRDVSVLKQVESALRQSEEQFRQLAENIGEVFWITGSNRSQLIYVSPAYELIWGRSCESLYANSQAWIESIHPEDRGRVASLVQEQGLQDWEIEYRVVRPDQTVRWIRDRAFPIHDESGEVYRFAGIAEDITLRKQAEQEAKLLQTMTQAILESEDFHSALQVALQKVCEATTWAVGEAWVPHTEKAILECSPVWYSKVDGLTEFRTVSREFVFPPGVGLPGRVWAAKYPEWCRDVSSEASSVYLRAKLALDAD